MKYSERGIALPLVLIYTLILTITGMAFLYLGGDERTLVQRDVNSARAFYAAEAGIEYGVFQLNKLLGEQTELTDSNNDIVDDYGIPLPDMEGFTFDVFTIEKVGDVERKVIESGPHKGMEGLIQKYKITSQATSNSSNSASARIVQWVEDQRVHIFQFATFYDQDLELEPGSPMTMTGRIHSNRDIYLTSGQLKVDSYVTSAGDIYRTDKPGDTAGESGDTQIKDKDGDYQYLSFDSTDPDWATKAEERWGGTVLSKDHGVQTLTIPMPTTEEPIEVIKRGNTIDPDSSSESETLKEARLYWQADLRIIDGQAYDKSGNVVDLTYTDAEGNTINPLNLSKSFYNYREGKDIKVTEIDIAKLVESGHFPANGILYVSTHSAGPGEEDGVRLVNGSGLPSGGLTVATDNPLYIQGDYNLNEAPAAVLCDAINILSNSWQDGQDWPPAAAAETQVNSCIATGHTPTSDGGYGGGLENLTRFLETWSGVTFTWSGSIDSLWYSEIAIGDWNYGWPYYEAPFRNWEFDEQLLNVSGLPPGTPLLCISHRSGWEEGFAQ